MGWCKWTFEQTDNTYLSMIELAGEGCIDYLALTHPMKRSGKTASTKEKPAKAQVARSLMGYLRGLKAKQNANRRTTPNPD